MRTFSQRTLALAFGLAFASLIGLAVVSDLSARRATGSTQWIVHTEQVLKQLNLLRADIAETESELRGYVLTGDERYLIGFQTVLDRSDASLKEVSRLTADNQVQQRALNQVRPLLADKVTAMRAIADLRRENATATAAQLMRAKFEPLSDEVRRRLQAMTAEERKLLDERFARSAANTKSTDLLRLIGLTACLALLLATFWVLNRALSEHKQLELQRETFFQVSLDMLCFAGFDGYFQRLNPAWEKTLGFTVEELMSKPYVEFVHPDDRESTLSQAGALVGGDVVVSFENRFLCKDGSYKWLLWNSVPIPQQRIVYAVARDLTERKRAEEQLRALSLTDDLTALRNRRGFLLLAEQELKLVRDRRRKDADVHLWLIFADLNGLKRINDTLGHNVGSQAIIHTAEVLTKIFRDADVIARLGGDEFAVLALNNEPDAGDRLVDRIRAAMNRFNVDHQLPYCLSLSLGVVKVDAGVASIEEMLAEADRLMYEDKRTRKGDAASDAGAPRS